MLTAGSWSLPVVTVLPLELPPLPLNAPPLPRRFGRYVLFEFIGRGGMAEIYLARATTDLGASRLCVVKQIIAEYASDPQFAEMLVYEAKVAAKLSHPNIVQVFDLGRGALESGGNDGLFIAMEYVEGFDLAALWRQCARADVPLPREFALRIVCEVLRGLEYAHRRLGPAGTPLGIVHRDVTPSNVLISFEGEVKLCDFGIARANILVGDVERKDDDALKGKAGYMSPEHARGEVIDARADIFAATILLWELVHGKRLYQRGGDRPSLLDQARAGEIPALVPQEFPDVERLQAIIAKGLMFDREERYASASLMLRDLERYTRQNDLVASPLRLGGWMFENFGEALVEHRRERERISERPNFEPTFESEVIPPEPPAWPEEALAVQNAANLGRLKAIAAGQSNARVWQLIALVLMLVGVAMLLARRGHF